MQRLASRAAVGCHDLNDNEMSKKVRRLTRQITVRAALARVPSRLGAPCHPKGMDQENRPADSCRNSPADQLMCITPDARPANSPHSDMRCTATTSEAPVRAAR